MNKISIYVRSEEKIYVEILEDIIFFNGKTLDEVFEHLIEEDQIKNGDCIDIILHFQYYSEINKKIDSNKIKEVKGKIKKYKLKLKKISVDIFSIFYGYKEENKEILIIGEKDSRILKIENKEIKEIETHLFNIEDFESEKFDFGDMPVIGVSEFDIKNIFLWAKQEKINYLKIDLNLSKKDFVILFSIFLIPALLNNIFSLNERNYKIREYSEILDNKEEELSKFKELDVESYEEELKMFEEIDDELKRKDFYTFILNLLRVSFYGINYNKITYEKEIWKIGGNTENYNNLIKFEEDLKKKYKNIELQYLKDGNGEETIFEYDIYNF